MVSPCNIGHFEVVQVAITLSMPFLSRRVLDDAFQAHNIHILHQVG